MGCGGVSTSNETDAQPPAIDSAPPIDAAEVPCAPALVFTRGGDIHRVEADGSDLQNLTNRAEDFQDQPRISPAGAHIAYYSNEMRTEGDIFVMEIDGANPRRVTLDEGNLRMPTWTSPTRVAFGTSVVGSTSYEVAVVNLDGSGRQTVAMDGFPNGGLGSSVAGGKISYREDAVMGAAPLKLVNFDGSEPFILAPAAGHTVFSPDGTQMAYTLSSIFRVNVDGTDRIELTANSAELDFFPSWTPDGAQIYFRRNVNVEGATQTDIFVMNSDGSGQTNLTNSPGNESAPFLSPDGEILAYTTSEGLTLAAPDGTNPTLVTGTQNAVDPQWTPCAAQTD